MISGLGFRVGFLGVAPEAGNPRPEPLVSNLQPPTSSLQPLGMTHAPSASHATDTTPLDGKHAVVTGGGRGIGAAVTVELARLGASVTIMGRDAHALTAYARELHATVTTEVNAVQCDVADAGSIAGAFAAARERFGTVYALVNNAGQAEGALLGDTSRELWDRLLAVNLTGAYECMRQVLPAMIASRAGRIVNIASTAGLRGYARMSAYCASKHGLVGLTRAVAQEVAKAGVTVNAVCPGYTDTNMAQQAIDALIDAGKAASRDEALGMIARINPRRVLVTPHEVASAVAWLCSPGASGVTGEEIVVANGEVV